MRELEGRLKTKNVNQNIMSIAIAKNVLLENIMELADKEVDGTLTCKTSSSSVASRGLIECMRLLIAHNTLLWVQMPRVLTRPVGY